MKIIKHPGFLGLCAFIFTLALVLPFSRLGVDTHHDGIMFASAMAVRNGYQIQKEAYAQYGPMVPWIQGVELLIFGNKIVVIKIFSAVSIAFTSGFFAYFFARRFSFKVAFLTISVWLACYYGFESSMMPLAWSSDYLLLIFGLILVLCMNLRSPNLTRNMIIRFVIGFCFGISIFIRINSGIPVAISFILLVLFLLKFETSKFYLMGMIASLVSILGYFAAIGSLNVWYEQTIEFPRHLYVTLSWRGALTGIRTNSMVYGLPAIGVLLTIYLLMRNLKPLKPLIGGKRVLYSFSLVLSALFLTWIFRGNVALDPLDPKNFLWVVVPAAVVLIPYAVHELLHEDLSGFLEENIAFFSIAFCGLIQIYPVYDPRHLWWAALPMAGYLFDKIFLKLNPRSGILFIAIIGSLLVPQTVTLARNTLGSDRVAMNFVPSLKGSLVDRDFYAAFKLQLQAVHDYQATHGDKSVLNLCRDGFFATVGKQFELLDPYYILWSFPKQSWSEERRRTYVAETKPLIWMCSPVENFAETASAYGYRVIPRDVCIGDDPKFQTWPLVGQLAVPQEWPALDVDLRAVDPTKCQIDN